MQASDKETYGRLKGRRLIDWSVGIRVRLADIRVARSVDEIVRSERGYRLSTCFPIA